MPLPPTSHSHADASGADVVTVVGAGLAGSMLALLLGQAGINVRLLDKQHKPPHTSSSSENTSSGSTNAATDAANAATDAANAAIDAANTDFHAADTDLHAANTPAAAAAADDDDDDDDEDAFRHVRSSTRRSINLALSHRGISALKAANVWPDVKKLLLPMRGRCIHMPDGSTSIQPYSDENQAIFSVPRNRLNALLLRQLQRLDNVEIVFDCKVERVEPVSGNLHVKFGSSSGSSSRRSTLRSNVVIGADGAFSCVRDSLAKTSRLDFAQKFHHVGYREFTIPPTAKGEFALADPENLHIWPRHNFMMIALPNADKSFTATLFLPWKGEPGLEDLNDAKAMTTFLQRHMSDLVALLPDVKQQMANGCGSPLLSVVCSPWASARVLLIGDAAHAAVPFYGQGMNAAFEDALMLFDMWKSSSSSSDGGDENRSRNRCSSSSSAEIWPEILQRFSEARQPAGEALVHLSLGNFREMSSLTATPSFVWKKRVDTLLHRLAPSFWTPLYSLVSFSRTPYHKALLQARRQDRALAIAAATAAIAFFVSAAVATARISRRLRGSD